MSEHLQPLLHGETVVLSAPTQIWSSPDGFIGGRPIHGVFHSDVRFVAGLTVTANGLPGEHIATTVLSADAVRFERVLRHLDGPGADPDVIGTLTRTATPGAMRDVIAIRSRRDVPLDVELVVSLSPDASTMELVKNGRRESLATPPVIEGHCATWGADTGRASLTAPGATIRALGDALELAWRVGVPARGEASVEWSLELVDPSAVVRGVTTPVDWSLPAGAETLDPRLQRWARVSLDDLAALRLELPELPGETFLAAGAPWFLTLFGRDSIWAARMLAPVDAGLAVSTLRVLAALQGTSIDRDTAEQPGKIVHELRRGAAFEPSVGFALPPRYYGTIDATPLFACLFVDAWRVGLPREVVDELLPSFVAALEWMRDFGDADGDGLLEYIDETKRGLANQGWKDSGDSVQWLDGSLADGPIALSEVQAYAFEAAMGGAEVLESLGRDGTEWRDWAARVRERFHERFWLADADGPYLAIALDRDKRPVDSVTSNMGHVLGTGILSAEQARSIAARLRLPALDSGFGLRTMSSESGGFWPLSYHGGSVWTHDTAIAIRGLAREGLFAEAASLVEGLLSAAEHFEFRMPELHSGEARAVAPAPAPYPAACRPQAWSAAAAISIMADALAANEDAGA